MLSILVLTRFRDFCNFTGFGIHVEKEKEKSWMETYVIAEVRLIEHYQNDL